MNPVIIVLIVLAVVIFAIIICSIKVVRQSTAIVVERLGKFNRRALHLSVHRQKSRRTDFS